MNLIDEICQTFEKITDAPKTFIRGCSYFLISICQGLKVDPVYFDFRPNIYVMLSSPPGITRRSTLISRYTIPLFKKAYSLYLSQKFNISMHEARKITNSLIIEHGTVEGIADAISDALEKYKVDRFVISSAEFGGILLAGKSKDYLIGFFQLLSKLYDGEEYSESLSRRGKRKNPRYIPPNLYVCSLVGMQRPSMYLSREHFEQGLMRRYVFIYQDSKNKDRWLSIFDTRRPIYREKLFEDIANRLAMRIHNFTEPQRVVVEYKGNDLLKIKKDYDQLERKAEANLNPDDLLSYYYYTCITLIPRLMLIEALGRYDAPKNKRGQAVIEVTYEDFKKAINFMNEVYQHTKPEILKLDSFLPKKLEPYPVTGKLEQTLEIIKQCGTNGITDDELLRQVGILKSELREILTTLIKRGEIIVERLDTNNSVKYKFYYSGYNPKLTGKCLSSAVFYSIW